MSARLSFGRILIKLGRFVESLALCFMRPDDLIEFNQRADSTPWVLSMFAKPGWVNSGLRNEENELFKQVSKKNGDLLLIGLEGGRTAIVFDRAGFKVSGIDSISENVELTLRNTASSNVRIKAFVQDMNFFCVSPDDFDLVWMGDIQYSTIPTRKKRIEILKKISSVMKPGGYLICQFLFDSDRHYSKTVMLARKLFAFLTLGNTNLEKGDMVQERKRFVHAFTQKDEITKEFRAAGFEINFIQVPPATVWGGVVAKINNQII